MEQTHLLLKDAGVLNLFVAIYYILIQRYLVHNEKLSIFKNIKNEVFGTCIFGQFIILTLIKLKHRLIRNKIGVIKIWFLY